MWIHQEVANIMGVAVKELEEDGQFGLVYQSFLGFEIKVSLKGSLHLKNFGSFTKELFLPQNTGVWIWSFWGTKTWSIKFNSEVALEGGIMFV